MKKRIDSLDVHPSKRLYHSIIADYDVSKSICELIDNALDVWHYSNEKELFKLLIQIEFDIEQQTITIIDNAGGIDELDLSLVVAPGKSSNEDNQEIIGVFGVGAKRAVVALAEDVKIYSRKGSKKTFMIEFDQSWIEYEESWFLDYYEVDEIEENTTKIILSKLRKIITEEEINILKERFSATYGLLLLESNVQIRINKTKIKSKTFDKWAFPPDYQPNSISGKIAIEDESNGNVKILLIGGLVAKGEPAGGEFGVYFYCNNRLVARALKSYEVGFTAGQASKLNLVRVIVYLNGGARLMPWNSSKSDIDTKHKIFISLREKIVQLVGYYASLSSRLDDSWEDNVFKYTTGSISTRSLDDFSVSLKLRLPPLPKSRKSYDDKIKQLNIELARKKPWVTGIYESIIAVDKISKLNLSQKNRIVLVFLDSTLEIAFKEYLVNEVPESISEDRLANTFKKRDDVHDAVAKKISFTEEEWNCIRYYYKQRCDLVHRKASSNFSDEDLYKFKKVVESILNKMFGLRFV